jgi:Coenzyme PQQ synthesis protein D (PqqD)
MLKTKRATEKELHEWLATIPVKNCDYFEDANGNYTLKAQKSGNAVAQKIIARISKSPYLKIKLDKRGSFIWKHCDGKNSIDSICQLLEAEFGDAVKPTANRTVELFKNLYNHRLVKFFTSTTL